MLISPFSEMKRPEFVKLPVALISTLEAVIFPAFVKSITGFTSNFPAVIVICELFAKLFFTFALKFPEVTSIVSLFSKSVVSSSPFCAFIFPVFVIDVAMIDKSPVAVRIPAFVTIPESMLILLADISFSASFVKLADFMLILPFSEMSFPVLEKSFVVSNVNPFLNFFSEFSGKFMLPFDCKTTDFSNSISKL